MAVNQNTKWDNEHVFIAATSGGGKSQFLRNEVLPRKNGQRALLWDVDADHQCVRYDNRREFAKAVKQAVKAGKGFRIGWSGADDKATFMWFCEVAWAILDGRYQTNILVEEVADLELGQSCPDFLRKLQVRGRKYGARVITSTQRCQEVPKLLLTQSGTRYIGIHDEYDAKYLARNLGISADDIEALDPLTFLCKSGRETTTVSTKYRDFSPS